MRSRILAGAIFAFAASGCGGGYGSNAPSMPTPTASSTAPAGAVTLSIMGQRNDQSFIPNPASMTQGTFVVWHNNDSTIHRIVMNDGSFDSGDIGPGATSMAMRLSSASGSYHCTIHPTTMWGSINGAGEPPGTGPGGY